MVPLLHHENWNEIEVRNAVLGHQAVLHIFDFGCVCWLGAPFLDQLTAKAEGAQSAHWWLRMQGLLTLFSRPSKTVYGALVTVIPSSFLVARSESWVLSEDRCFCSSQGMLLSRLQRYYLSPNTPYTPSPTANIAMGHWGKRRHLRRAQPQNYAWHKKFGISFIHFLLFRVPLRRVHMWKLQRVFQAHRPEQENLHVP